MEAHQSSMRLKQPSPVAGICTRSKSQIHLHPNRSGQARISQGHPNLPTYEPQRKRSRSGDPITEASLDDILILKILSKDLRVKRIFSPVSRPPEAVTDNQISGVEFPSHEKEDCPKAAEKSGFEISGSRLIPSGRDMDGSVSKKTEISEMGFVLGAQQPDTMSLQSPARNGAEGRLILVEQSGGGPNQECAQKSSPEMRENGVRLDQNERKEVLKPRQRVFKPPGSFSYRRLLPYLKNMSKHNSCVLDFCREQNIDKGLDGKPFQVIRASENQESSLYQYDEIKLSSECCASVSSTPLENVQVSSLETSNGNEPSSESPEYVPKSPPLTVVDECLPKAPVDGQTENLDVVVGKKAVADGEILSKSDAEILSKLEVEVILSKLEVLNPFSRLKLFRSPGSISYRRLLPYLMDMKKSNSSGNNTDKDLEHGLLPSLTPTQKATPMDESKGSTFHSDHQICEPGTLPTAQITSASGSSADSGENLTSLERMTESRMSIGLQKEQHVEQAASDNKHLDIMSLGHDTDWPATILCPSTCEATLIKHGTISVANSLWDDEKPVQADSLCQNASQIAASVSSGIPAVSLRKQILKRNPRGCRGHCTCLNCASFCLHAERAFEFSRNQMEDAEEVALDLVKQLSNLRKMIEMSAVGANNHAIDLNEVKEACRKASEAEDVARSRLDEMNNDLNIHCRIKCFHGPKVTFANFIEEKVIPEA